MKEFLSQKGVDYEELNVAKDETARNEMLRKTGKMAVPTIVVGEKAIVGFDKSELERIIH